MTAACADDTSMMVEAVGSALVQISLIPLNGRGAQVSLSPDKAEQVAHHLLKLVAKLRLDR